MSINSNKTPDKSTPATTPAIFDNLDDFLAYVKASGTNEVFVSVTTNPKSVRDPRADVYHVVMSALVRKLKPGRKRVTEEAKVTFTDALDLLVVDQIAQREKFDEMTTEALEPFVTRALKLGFDVKRGQL